MADWGDWTQMFESSGLGDGWGTMPQNVAMDIAGAGGGGWWDSLSSGAGSLMRGVGKVADVLGSPTTLNLAKLGLTGMGAYAGSQAMEQAGEQTKLLKAAEARSAEAQKQAGETSTAARAAAAPAIAAESRLIPAGTAALLGEAPLPPGLEAGVQKWITEAKAAAASYYARAGISDSTMMTQLDSWIDSQATEMRTKLAQGLLQSGEAAGATAGSQLGTAASAAGTAGAGQAGTLPQQQSGTLAQALQSANEALYNLLGRTAQ